MLWRRRHCTITGIICTHHHQLQDYTTNSVRPRTQQVHRAVGQICFASRALPVLFRNRSPSESTVEAISVRHTYHNDWPKTPQADRDFASSPFRSPLLVYFTSTVNRFLYSQSMSRWGRPQTFALRGGVSRCLSVRYGGGRTTDKSSAHNYNNGIGLTYL